MTETIIVALITGGLTALSSIVVAISNNSKTIYRIAELEKEVEKLDKKVEKHNNFLERITILEQSDKSQWKYIDSFKEERK